MFYAYLGVVLSGLVAAVSSAHAGAMVTVAVLSLAVVTFLAWLAQWWWSGRVEAQVASSLISPRPLGQQPSAWGRLRPRHLRLAHHDKAQLSIEGQPITAFRWAN